jgi:hypothetical protein
MTVDQILNAAAGTFAERNTTYKDAWKQVGPVLDALFPELILAGPERYTKFHLVVLIVVKLTRFANSDMTHQDSLRDIITHAAMLEALLGEG